MNPGEFKNAVEQLKKEKGIEPDIIYNAMELALISAYKKNYDSLPNVRVEINKNEGDIKIFSFKTVIQDDYEKLEEKDNKIYEKQKTELEEQEEKLETLNEESEDYVQQQEIITEMKTEMIKPFIFDERIHLTITDAKKIVKGITISETIEKEVTPTDFGRVATSTAKQVVIQKIREAERIVILENFESKEGEMISGLVAMEDPRNYYIHLGKAQGILPKNEILQGEIIKMGSNIKVYVTKVEDGAKGPTILLSRNHYNFVKRLFELEIPEVNDGTVLIYSIAREAGIRTKVAVYSENKQVDPIGACIGEGGSRINRIVKELNGEKIDLVLYNKTKSEFIKNSLSPSENLIVLLTDETSDTATVIADNQNLALAIGKGGLNVRLASRLTQTKIDIKSQEDAQKMGINILT